MLHTLNSYSVTCRALLPPPSVLQGSWIIRQSVGTTPVLLGQKLTTKYSRGPNYLEVRLYCLLLLLCTAAGPEADHQVQPGTWRCAPAHQPIVRWIL